MILSDQPKNCRLCGALLGEKNRLILEPAPAGAQVFLETPDQKLNDKIALTIEQCGECGLVQSTSEPVSYYRRVITAAGFSPAMVEYRKKQAKLFADTFGLQGKHAVEIGCHHGYFLEILAEAGMKPHGTEWQNPREGPKKYPVADTYPEEGVRIPGAPFAAFFCINFLEHAPDPRTFLKCVRENIGDAGVGLVEVPNYRQQSRMGRVFDYIADHLSYFDEETLSIALTMSGFEVEKMTETRGGENLEAWVRVRRPRDLSGESSRIEIARKGVREWLNQQNARGLKTGIWGASHQALTLLAFLRSGEVAGIFDSAPFKQGRFAPVTRIPILKPGAERLKELDSILIVAAGYEKEIALTLREKFGFSGAVYQISGSMIKNMD